MKKLILSLIITASICVDSFAHHSVIKTQATSSNTRMKICNQQQRDLIIANASNSAGIYDFVQINSPSNVVEFWTWKGAGDGTDATRFATAADWQNLFSHANPSINSINLTTNITNVNNPALNNTNVFSYNRSFYTTDSFNSNSFVYQFNIPNFYLNVGTPITPIDPGYNGTGYSIVNGDDSSLPPLPIGLSFNTTTGIISGTPTAENGIYGHNYLVRFTPPSSLPIYFYFIYIKVSPAILTTESFSPNSLSVYPNPTKDLLHIDLQNELLGKIIDLTGKTLMNVTTKDIDISSLSAGIYLLYIVSDGKHYVSKIVKE